MEKRKKEQTASSTLKAEYIACHTTTKYAIWLKQFNSKLKIVDSVQKPLIIFCDNQAAIKYVQNDYITKDNKHIDIKYHCVINCVESSLLT